MNKRCRDAAKTIAPALSRTGAAMRVATLVLFLVAEFPFAANVRASTLLFSTGFESATTLSQIKQDYCYTTGCWQPISGVDNITGQAWPGNILGSSANGGVLSQLHADAPVSETTVRDYAFDQIVTLTGHNGSPTHALYRQVTQSGCCGQDAQSGVTQNTLLTNPSISSFSQETDMYISYWLKFQPDLPQLMQVGTPDSGWNWRAVFTWKTDGDYRVTAQINRDPYINGGNLFWNVVGDNQADGGLPYKAFWQEQNTSVPVPVGQWFKFEVFWHRSSGSDGRIWIAINGQVIVDHLGRNTASSDPQDPEYGFSDSPRPINRIFMNVLYSSTAYPIYQWVDDLQIWNGFPADCADPPCAPH